MYVHVCIETCAVSSKMVAVVFSDTHTHILPKMEAGLDWWFVLYIFLLVALLFNYGAFQSIHSLKWAIL